MGDSLDGIVARIRDCETRTGAALDILSDRFCAAAFYVGLAWTLPHLSPAIFVYLAEFMVIDCFISLSVTGLADHEPQLLPRHRPADLAVQLVTRRQDRQLGSLRGDAAAHA